MTHYRRSLTALVCGLLSGASPLFAADPSLPATEEHPVTDEYHHVTVSDPYRWLEDSSDARVKAWVKEENAVTRAHLERLPQRPLIHDRLYKYVSASSPYYRDLYAVGDLIFARYSQPPKQQPMIAVLPANADPSRARVIIDPNTMNPKGTTAFDWFVPSPDGKLLAVSLSENGSEVGTLHIFEVATGKQVGPEIPRVQFPTGGGSVAWRADSQAFWYTRYPGDERPAAERTFFQQIYFHKVGDNPAADTYVLGKELPKLAEIHLDARYNPKIIVVQVANGDGGEFNYYLLDERGKSSRLTRFEDQVVAATVGVDGATYLVSRKSAPHGRLLKLDPGVTKLEKATVLIPESDGVIEESGESGGEPVIVTPTAIYMRELVGGPSRVSIFEPGGKSKGTLPLPNVAAVAEMERVGNGELLYSIETYLRPPYFSRYSAKTGSAAETRLAKTTAVSFADTEVVREMAKSKDGTPVPINIIRRKGTRLDGSNPVLLYGYGGYGVSETPSFLDAYGRVWLDAGGVYVDANIRGGGEFGESWHQQGALTHKQNVFDDFIAAAERVIADRYTTSARLAILGDSNGGLLMGAVMTQRPDLYRAVVSHVGIYDMLRVELDPNGAFNTTEFGSTRDPAQFRALFAYSPYHHVKVATAYPAVLMQTGATDGRVNPAHSRKMAARLQAATSSGRPVLLSVDDHSGHGMGSALSIRVDQEADQLSFLFEQLGMMLPVK